MKSAIAEIPDGRKHHGAIQSLTLAALGIVFGDIGTSPLYALRETFHHSNGFAVNQLNVLGILSLILWSLIVVISLKYLLFVLRADNKGEGGVLALTALTVPSRFPTSLAGKTLLYLGLFGAALLYGDGVITPAISVLSAVEGLEVATHMFTPFVLPITFGILIALFMSQRQGTAKIGKVFGPIICLWFLTIGILGVFGILQNPSVIAALNPQYAFQFFIQNGFGGFLVLGSVFLAVTGGEALYADMGHFGRRPIQRGWFFVAFPALALNYFGQGAIILQDPQAVANPFYNLAPDWALYPLVTLATLATVIASQALISGIFSVTRQAMQLGFMPRFQIVHTSSEEIGQIYLPKINWTLLVMTLWCVFEFRTSSALASAYGIAVSITMVITTLLACSVAMSHWRWSKVKTFSVLFLFLLVDFVFLGSNLAKIGDGGWVTLAIGGFMFTVMTTWRRGRFILAQRLRSKSIAFSEFLKQIGANPPARVSGVAIFMTGDPEGTPPALLHNVKHSKVLHSKNALLTVEHAEHPYINEFDGITFEELSSDFYRIKARYGFMQAPDIHQILKVCSQKNLHFDIEEITFFLGRETLFASPKPGMALWREHLFSFMSQNAERATAYFNIPPDRVVEIGLQIEL